MNRAEVRRRQAGLFFDILLLAVVLVLGHRIGDNGITYMTVAAAAYALFWTAVGGGLSDTLGRLLRSRRNKGQYRNIAKMRKSVMIFQTILGLGGSLLLCLLAERIGEGLFGVRYSTFIIMALSPAVFFRTVSSVLMGYFQGEGSELPTAAAGLLRTVFTLGFGLLFSGILGGYGERAGRLLREENFSAMYGGLGIALAVCLGEALILLFLALIYKAGGNRRTEGRQEGYGTESFFDCVRYLWNGRWQQAAGGLLAFLPLGLGLFFHGKRTEDSAAFAAGYSVYVEYVAICAVLVWLVYILVLPAAGRIFVSLRKSEHRFARSAFEGGLHICLVNSVFAAVFLAVMGEEAGELLCPESVSALLPMLRSGSCVIVFTALSCYFARFLMTAGKRYPVLLAVGAADLSFLVILLTTGRAGVLSLVYGGIVGTFVLCIMLGVFACGQLRSRPDWLNVAVVPAAAAGGTGLLCMLAEKLLSPHLPAAVTLLAAFVAGGIIYWVALAALRNFREPELEMMPGGRLIGGLGQRLHID